MLADDLLVGNDRVQTDERDLGRGSCSHASGRFVGDTAGRPVDPGARGDGRVGGAYNLVRIARWLAQPAQASNQASS
jgi:hypothetical protein